MKKIYIFLIALVASATHVKAQYFLQDFETSADIATYVANATTATTIAAGNNQFDYSLVATDANLASGSIEINSESGSNRLNLQSPKNTGTGFSISRSTSLGLKNSGKGVFQMAFDFECKAQSGTGVAPFFILIGTAGEGLAPTAINTPNANDANIFFKMQVVTFNNTKTGSLSGNFYIRPVFSGDQAIDSRRDYTGPQRITITFNNTALPTTYTPPTGGVKTLLAGKTDIYVGSVLSYDNLANCGFGAGENYTAGSQELNAFKILSGAGASNISFDNMVFQDAPIAPLPVDLVSFAGKSQQNGVGLNWVTASEQNSDYFEVSKFNADTKSYLPFAKVNAAGNANEKITYQCVDAKPQIGVNYYQLKQVDKDGTSKIYDEISVDNSFGIPSFEVAKSDDGYQYKVFSNEQGIAELAVVSLDGKVLSKESVQINAGFNTGMVTTTTLNTGLYLVRFKDANNQVTVKKIIVTAN